MKKTPSVWVKPSLIFLSNNAIQTGSTIATAFETILACNGPVYSTYSNAGPGNDPDCGVVTNTLGGTGTGLAAFATCFGACS